MLIHHELVTDFNSLLPEHPSYVDGHALAEEDSFRSDADTVGTVGTVDSASRSDAQPVRKSGWHLSGILRNIAIQLGIVDYESDGDGWEQHDDEDTLTDSIIELFDRKQKDQLLTDVLSMVTGVMFPIGLTPKQLQSQVQTQTKPVKSFQLNLKMLMGFMWEEWAVKRVPSISGTMWRPGQWAIPVLGGKKASRYVWASPDGYTQQTKWLDGVKVMTGAGRLVTPKSDYTGQVVSCGEEFKFTQKSARKPIEKQWLWHRQMMGYAQPECLDVKFFRLHVLYGNGVYEKARLGEPQYWRYWIEYTDWELQQMWSVVEQYVSESGR